MIKNRILFIVVVFAALVSLLSGCGDSNHINIPADEISQIWMETYPAKSDSPKYTDNEETIKTVSSYINDLKLRPHTSSDEDVNGMSVRIDILMNDGTWKTFWHSRTYFTDTDMNQYVMEYEQAIELDSIYSKLNSVPVITGTVAEVGETDNDKVRLLISVDSGFHKIIGDKSYVTVENQRLYKSGYPNADIGVGDRIEFTINGGIKESYPTQCSVAKLTIIESASGLYYQHLPAVSEDGDPYFVLFDELFFDDPALNDNIQYISVDLSKAKSTDTSNFIELMRAWCERNSCILLEQTYDQLVEGGWIKDLYFEEGILISFEDISLNETKLVTKAQKWRSGLGAIGAEYTLENENGIWRVVQTEKQWIS